jgi:hypothetical protein
MKTDENMMTNDFVICIPLSDKLLILNSLFRISTLLQIHKINKTNKLHKNAIKDLYPP